MLTGALLRGSLPAGAAAELPAAGAGALRGPAGAAALASGRGSCVPGLPAVLAPCGSVLPWPVFGDESGVWLVAKSCLLASGAGCCRPGGSCTAWPLRVRVLRVGGRRVGPGRPPAAAVRGSSRAGALPDMTRDMGPGAARCMPASGPSGDFCDRWSCRRAAIVGAELLHSHIRWTGKTQVRCQDALPRPGRPAETVWRDGLFR